MPSPRSTSFVRERREDGGDDEPHRPPTVNAAAESEGGDACGGDGDLVSWPGDRSCKVNVGSSAVAAVAVVSVVIGVEGVNDVAGGGAEGFGLTSVSAVSVGDGDTVYACCRLCRCACRSSALLVSA